MVVAGNICGKVKNIGWLDTLRSRNEIRKLTLQPAQDGTAKLEVQAAIVRMGSLSAHVWVNFTDLCHQLGIHKAPKHTGSQLFPKT